MMPYHLNDRHLLPRQPQLTTTESSEASIGSGTRLISVSLTATSLGLPATSGPVSLLTSGTSLPVTGSSSLASAIPTASTAATPTTQTFPTRTLVAICVSAGILLGGVVIFVLWWDRSKKKAPEEPPVEENYSQDASTQDMKLRGLTGVHAAPPPPINNLRRPSTGATAYDHGYHGAAGGKGGYDHDGKQSFDLGFRPATGSNYIQEESFRAFAPTKIDTSRPQTVSPTTPPQSVPQSPRSASAQPIIQPYSVGSHPYASPALSHTQFYQPSFERTATSTTAIASPDLDLSARLGLNTAGFAGVGTRPGYDAYGLESRTAGATSSNHNGTIPSRPSIESIRNLARKASQSNVQGEATYPPTGGFTRTRNNSTSTYAGSVRTGKVKPTKEEKAKELAAMDHLIAALDESAEAERRRKERLVAAAGITDVSQSSSKKSAGTSRRKDTAITGSYPLPPPDVFRAALSRGHADEEPDDDEIERWRRS